MSTENDFRPLPCASCNRQPWVGRSTASHHTHISCCGVIAEGDDLARAKSTWGRIQRGLILEASAIDHRKVLRDRLLRLIKTRGETSEGVLLNLVRPISREAMNRELVHLMQDSKISGLERNNPRNKKTHLIYRYEQE